MTSISIATERWLPVPGYEALYEVSDQGRVQSLSRPSQDGVRSYPGIILKPWLKRSHRTDRGHLLVTLWKGGHGRKIPVHQLVLLAFVGPCPAGMEVLHGPGGNLDNRLTNLRYGTHRENAADAVRDGMMHRGERTGSSKLTAEIVREIRRLRVLGVRQADLAQRFGVTQSAISFAEHGRNWGHVS